MTDQDQIPQTPIEPARRGILERLSIVWIIPVAALAIALGIAWSSLQNRGALIEIAFSNAAGIVAEQTQLRYRELSVGVVEEVTFAPGLEKVIAHVRLDKDVEPYVDADAVFWVVQPEVTARGISGLNTVLSGVYIEGSWDGTPGGLQRHFTGEDHRPVARPDKPGRRIVLSSNTGKGLNEGTPILYKGLEVGRIGRPQLSPDGVTITAEAFIEAPHDQLLSSRSRFWNASGVSFNLGAAGASVDIDSVASLISGGVSFETVVSGGVPVEDGAEFAVFTNQDDARSNLFEGGGPKGGTVSIAMVFEENVTGLSVGAPVTLSGLQIGEVIGLSGKVDEAQFGDERVRLIVVLAIDLDQLELGPQTTDEDAILDFFDQAVADGWRARLTKASLLSGGLKIEMVQVEDAPPARFMRDGDPYPIFPSVAAEQSETGASAQGLLNRVNDLPVEQLMTSIVTFMENATALVASEDLQSLPAQLNGAVTDLRSVLSSEDLQAIPERLTVVTEEIALLLEELRSRDGMSKLVDAVENAGDAATSIANAAEEVPALVGKVEALAAKVAALDVQSLLTSVSNLATSAEEILATEAAKDLPERLNTALASLDETVGEATALLAGLNEADAAAQLSDTLSATGEAASGIRDAVAGVPDLVTRIDAVAAKAEAIELDRLAREITELVASAEALIDTEGARNLPESLGKALDEMALVLTDLRAGGTVENVNATLASARQAAGAVAEVSDDLPALVQEAQSVLARADDVLAGFSESGPLNKEARNAMREVARAADAVRSLARTLERKPNALLTGK